MTRLVRRNWPLSLLTLFLLLSASASPAGAQDAGAVTDQAKAAPPGKGEAPDPTRIPGGCRFHPRCPVVVSGRARELGIEDRCRGEDLEVIEETGTRQTAACYLVPLGERP